MKALVLDFDGVIADSAREAFRIALGTYLELRPDTTLAAREESELYRQFVELIPLGNRAEDFGTSFAAIESGDIPRDQQSYDRFRDERGAEWLDRYHRRFYATRRAIAASDPAGWRALLGPYPRFVEILRRRAGQSVYAIATARDRESVDGLLADYGLAELFPPRLVTDKEAGTRKDAHLALLRERLDLRYEEMTFVDDKVNHLEDVAALGVRCMLAGWGYNGPREHRLAAEQGFTVCRLDDVEARLFS